MPPPRTTKRHSQASRRPESQVPAWVWLFTGGVLGAFIMFLVHLAQIKALQEQHTKAVVAQKDGKEAAPAEEDSRGLHVPQFDFYDLLKETRVKVPDFGPTDVGKTESEAEPVEYILQVASFKSKEDAEELRASLILLNLEATRETVNIRNGEKWHRVLVGPFTSRSMLAKARGTLISNNYEALILKRAPQN